MDSKLGTTLTGSLAIVPFLMLCAHLLARM